MIIEYMQAVMQYDPAAGNELMKLNLKHVAKQLKVTEEELLIGKLTQKAKENEKNKR